MTILQEDAHTHSRQPKVNLDALTSSDFPAAMTARLPQENRWDTAFPLQPLNDASQATFGQAASRQLWADSPTGPSGCGDQSRLGTSAKATRAWIILLATGTANLVLLAFHSLFAAFFLLVIALILLTSTSGVNAQPRQNGGSCADGDCTGGGGGGCGN